MSQTERRITAAEVREGTRLAHDRAESGSIGVTAVNRYDDEVTLTFESGHQRTYHADAGLYEVTG